MIGVYHVVPVTITGLGENNRLVFVGVRIELEQVIRIYSTRATGLGIFIIICNMFNAGG